MYEFSWQQTQMEEIHKTFLQFPFPVHDGSEAHHPKPIQLEEYPAEFLSTLLDNAVAHPLITMAHLDKNGYPFISVMGFSFFDGKINTAARGGALKLKRLREDPRCSFSYHNMAPRSHMLACVTLVGKAVVATDPELVRRANEALQHKNYHEGDPDRDRLGPALENMENAQRELIILDEVEAVYIISPMRLDPKIGGVPTPVISWRADRKKSG